MDHFSRENDPKLQKNAGFLTVLRTSLQPRIEIRRSDSAAKLRKPAPVRSPPNEP
jgi:hypothetical protein